MFPVTLFYPTRPSTLDYVAFVAPHITGSQVEISQASTDSSPAQLFDATISYPTLLQKGIQAPGNWRRLIKDA